MMQSKIEQLRHNAELLGLSYSVCNNSIKVVISESENRFFCFSKNDLEVLRNMTRMADEVQMYPNQDKNDRDVSCTVVFKISERL